MTIIAVSTAQELMEALESANGGDRIELAAGDYGDIKLKNVVFDSKVTIASADPDAQATFNTVELYGVENLAFDNVFFDFHPTADTLNHHSALRVTHSSHISVTNSKFEGDVAVDGHPQDTDPAIVGSQGIEGYPVGRAAIVNWADDITFAGNDISMFRAGITVAYVDGLTIDDNELYDLRTTAINGGDVSDVVLTGNHVYDMNPWAPLLANGVVNSQADHGDFIHFWTIAGQDSQNENIYIAGNFLELGIDGTQNASVLGIYLEDNDKNIGYNSILIENNVLHNDSLQGVAIEKATGVVIRDNTLLQSGGNASQAPGIVLRDGTRDVTIENNILTEIDGAAIHGTSIDAAAALNINIMGNVQVQRFNPEADNYVGHLFVNALTPNGDLDDFRVIPGSAADGVGAKLLQNSGESSLVAITASAKTGLESLSVSASVSDLLGGLSQSALSKMSIEWDFGDGTTGSGHAVEHSYAASGSYKISGTVTAPDGTKFLLNKVVEISTPIAITVDFETAIRDEGDIINDVTVNGAAVLQSAGNGKVLNLQSADARVKFDVNEELSNNREFTLTFDFKYDDETQDGSALYFPGTAVIQINKGQLQLIGKTSLNEAINFQTSGARLDDNSWHRLSYVFSNGTGTASLYLDGAVIGTLTGLNGIQPPSQSHGLTLGSPFGQSFTGQLDNVSFLRAALTEDDIDLLHGGTTVSLSELEGVSDPEPAAQPLVVEVAEIQDASDPVTVTEEPAQIVTATVAQIEDSKEIGVQVEERLVPEFVQPTMTFQPINENIDTTTVARLNPGLDEATLQELILQFSNFTTSDKHHSSGGWLEWAGTDETGGVATVTPIDAVGLYLLDGTDETENNQQAAEAPEGAFADQFLIGQDTFDFG